MKFVESLPIRKVSGIGNVTEQLLKRVLGIETCSDLYHKRGHLLLLFSEISAGNSVILLYFPFHNTYLFVYDLYLYFPYIHNSSKESYINDVTQFWTIVDPLLLSLRVILLRALGCHHKILDLLPPNTVTSFMDNPENVLFFYSATF